MALICGKGVNDMPQGYCRQGLIEQKIYETWRECFRKCYPTKKLNVQPTFKGCTVCDDWMYLSNFVRDIKDLKGYDEWLKGLKGEGPRLHFVTKDKVYSKENCEFTTHATRRKAWVNGNTNTGLEEE